MRVEQDKGKTATKNVARTQSGENVYKYALCLVDIGKLGTKTFSYLIPDALKNVIKIGQPVLLPFGPKRKVQGWVVGFSNYLETGIKVKNIDEILEPEPLFTLEYLKMLEFVANYYFCDLQAVLRVAIPKKYRTPRASKKVFSEGMLKALEGGHAKGEGEGAHVLTPAQQKVFDDINKVNPKNALIYGITGSGKTEIYFKLIEQTIASGKNVLFLAPEIALVSQLTMRTIERFGAGQVGIWHSSITDKEKIQVWQRLKDNEIKILFGARSSVFAPIKDLGLIIIDEQHDSAYKQTMLEQRYSYSAKMVAQKLGELWGAKIVQGSATPDVEDYYVAQNSNSLFTLNERFGSAKLPKVTVIDMKIERFEGNLGVFSRHLVKKIEETISSGKQVILLINRRGFSSYSQCMACGEVVECERCAIPLIYHAQGSSHKCHYCNFEARDLKVCPKCDDEALENFGTGVQRVEQITREIFKDASIARLDSDALNEQNEHIEILTAFKNGEIDILIGTQMIAKGLDNPNVELVGVINADLSFNLPDYRSSERGFSILTQVAGRSGRAGDTGRVVFQTYNAENAFLAHASEQNYPKFYADEIEMREALDYPPFSKVIRVVLSSSNPFRAEKSALEIAARLKTFIENQSLTERLIVLGPSPCVLEKIRNEYRFNLLVKNKLDERGHGFILNFLRGVILPKDIKMVVDIDPSDVL